MKLLNLKTVLSVCKCTFLWMRGCFVCNVHMIYWILAYDFDVIVLLFLFFLQQSEPAPAASTVSAFHCSMFSNPTDAQIHRTI